MNNGLLSGSHPGFFEGPIRPPLFPPISAPRVGTAVGYGTQLILGQGVNTNQVANTANTMYLGLTPIPSTWVIEEMEMYYGQNSQASGTRNDIPIYECGTDGLPARLVACGYIDCPTTSSGLQNKGLGMSVTVPYSGWFWVGFFHPVGAQIQYPTVTPAYGLCVNTSSVTFRPDGLRLQNIPSAHVSGFPPPDLSGIPLNSGSTGNYAMYPTSSYAPGLLVRGTTR